MSFSLRILKYYMSPYPQCHEQRNPLYQAIHVHPPQPTVMPAMTHSQPRPTNTLSLANPTFSGAVQQPPASIMIMQAGYLWPYTLSMQAGQGFNGVLHTYSALHSATMPGYVPLVATSSPFQKPQALQASTPIMAFQQPHPSNNKRYLITQISECNQQCTTDLAAEPSRSFF